MYENNIVDMHYNKLQTDFKAEAVAVNLLKYHRAVSNIFIERIGINDRAYLKDIKCISSNYLGFDEEVFTIVTSGREKKISLLMNRKFLIIAIRKEAGAFWINLNLT